MNGRPVNDIMKSLTDYLTFKERRKSMTKGSLQIKSNKYYAVFRVNGKVKWHSLGIEAKRGNKRKAEQAMAELAIQYNENP